MIIIVEYIVVFLYVLIIIENLNYKLCIHVEIPALTYSSIDIIRTVSVTSTIQSTCQFIPPTTITSQSMINNTESDNKSTTTAIIASSVAGALLFLCIISICIMVIMIKKCKTRKIRQGFFSAVTM